MFSDEDQYCYDFDDDLDELYDLAMFLISSNPMAELNDVRCLLFVCLLFIFCSSFDLLHLTELE